MCLKDLLDRGEISANVAFLFLKINPRFFRRVLTVFPPPLAANCDKSDQIFPVLFCLSVRAQRLRTKNYRLFRLELEWLVSIKWGHSKEWKMCFLTFSAVPTK